MGRRGANGSVLRFAVAVGRALGEEVAAETVAKAMKSQRDQKEALVV
jgi:hypothetical protein